MPVCGLFFWRICPNCLIIILGVSTICLSKMSKYQIVRSSEVTSVQTFANELC